MGWQGVIAVVTAAVFVLCYGAAVVVAEESYKEPLGVNSRGRAFLSQHGAGQKWEESSSAEAPQMNYDYFVQPSLETTGNTDKTLASRKQETLQHKTPSSHKQGTTEQSQEELMWPNDDPFSVFYDSMFPEMESVIPEEETRNKNIHTIPPKSIQESTSSLTRPASTIERTVDISPTTVVNEIQVPTTAPVPLSSSSMLSGISSPMPSLLNDSFHHEKFEKLITKMTLVLEKFGLSKSFTKKIFKEEEKFLNSLVHVKSLRDKLNFISNHKLSAVSSKLSLSSLLSEFGLEGIFEKIVSKVNFTDVATKLGVPDKALKMNLTNLISKFDIDDIMYIVDLVETASNLDYKDITSKMNLGNINTARLHQVQAGLAPLLAHFMNLESVHHATKRLGINEALMNGVLNSVGESARQILDDGNGGKLLLLPLLDTVSLNVVQTLGFTVLIFFLLLSAYSYVSVKTLTIARDGSEKPQVPRPSGLNLNGNPNWRTAVDAAEGVNLPWKHNRQQAEGQRQRESVVPNRPIPVPDPGILHRLGHHPAGHLRTPQQHANTRRGPLVVPVVNFRGDHHIRHVNNQQPSHPHPAPVKPHPHLPHLSPPPRPHIQHKHQQHQHQHQPYVQPPPYESFEPQQEDPDHYDRHRHFASYEDDYQYEGQNQDADDQFLGDKYQQYHGQRFEVESSSTRTPGNHWYTNPTTRPADDGDLHTYHHTPSNKHTWQPRRTSPHASSFITTIRPSFPITFTPPPTSPSPIRTRPTSKYAISVTSSLAEKKGLKTRRTKVTSEKQQLDESSEV